MVNNKKQNVLLVGNGAREHALAWKLLQSPKLAKLFVCSGNGGTEQIAQNVPIKISDSRRLVNFAKSNSIDLTIIGPDGPLANGVVDKFQKTGLRIFGPTKAAARIESSKVFSKKLMTRQQIPTAIYGTFQSYKQALEYVKKQKRPLVIKASGLALGKGVYICATRSEAQKALKEIMITKIFGDSGQEVVIEEFLTGQELSIHAFCDGKVFEMLPPAQDHKRIFANNLGPNTGGMGSFAPVEWVNSKLAREIRKTILWTTLNGLKEYGEIFKGCLFPGLIVKDQKPKVLEFNARFGDPETQVYMRLLKTDLLDIVNACVDGNLNKIKIVWSDQVAICVVLASKGYPAEYPKGYPISGIKEAEKLDGVVVFHAGTKLNNGRLITNGGRVLSVTAVGKTLREAQSRVYQAVGLIKFKGMQYRADIGAQALAHLD